MSSSAAEHVTRLLLTLVLATTTAMVAAKDHIKPDRLLLLDAEMAGERVVAVGERGQVLFSDDAGNTWQPAATPTETTLTAVDFVDARHGWAVGHDAVILHSGDGGTTWTQQYAAPEQESPLLDVLFSSELHGIAVGAYGSYLETRDGGKSWTARVIMEGDRHLNALDGHADRQLYAVAESGGVFTSIDQAQTWQPLPSPYHGSLFGILETGNAGLLAFGLRGEIHRSDDNGATWQVIDNPSRHSLMGGHAYADGLVVLVGNGGTVLISADHGRHFQHHPQADPRALATALRVGNRLIGFGEGGVMPITQQP